MLKTKQVKAKKVQTNQARTEKARTEKVRDEKVRSEKVRGEKVRGNKIRAEQVRTKRKSGFILCLLINMLLNYKGMIPAVVLLVLHFILNWSLWLSLAAFGAWLLWLILWMYLIGWTERYDNTPEPQKKNKNPYSADNSVKSDKSPE